MSQGVTEMRNDIREESKTSKVNTGNMSCYLKMFIKYK